MRPGCGFPRLSTGAARSAAAPGRSHRRLDRSARLYPSAADPDRFRQAPGPRLQRAGGSRPWSSRIAGKSKIVTWRPAGRLDALPSSREAKDGARRDGGRPAIVAGARRSASCSPATARSGSTGSGAPHTTLSLTAIADQPPQIRFADPPKAVSGGCRAGLGLELSRQG